MREIAVSRPRTELKRYQNTIYLGHSDRNEAGGTDPLARHDFRCRIITYKPLQLAEEEEEEFSYVTMQLKKKLCYRRGIAPENLRVPPAIV